MAEKSVARQAADLADKVSGMRTKGQARLDKLKAEIESKIDAEILAASDEVRLSYLALTGEEMPEVVDEVDVFGPDAGGPEL